MTRPDSDPARESAPHPDLLEATLADLASRLLAGELTARDLVERYMGRIEAINKRGPSIRAVLEINPDALVMAEALDLEQNRTRKRSPLHGIPVLLKDNVATADTMETAAGSLALLGARPSKDAFIVQRLRSAGAVLLGKTNMSEWANFRSTRSSSGWSARGGQGLNPYVLDTSPHGSSSGSASAVAANLAVAAIGTETDGSILVPAAVNGVVGIKPTVGLTSRSGIIPIAHSQDTVGPMARIVTDAAAVLSVIAGPDPDDPATAAAPTLDYTAFLDVNGFKGARIGVPRDVYWGYSPPADEVASQALEIMRELGAEIVDPANIPTARDLSRGWPPTDNSALTVLSYEFKADLNAYLARLPRASVRSLEDLIAFNEEHASEEMPYFGQELLLQSQAQGPLTDSIYLSALERNRRLAGKDGIDAVMDGHRLDALVMPTTSPATKIDLVNGSRSLGSSSRAPALVGYPAITVPAGFAFGLPLGITFVGKAFAEPSLIRLAYAFEQATRARRAPAFRPPSVSPARNPEGPATDPTHPSLE